MLWRVWSGQVSAEVLSERVLNEVKGEGHKIGCDGTGKEQSHCKGPETEGR